MTSFLGLHNLKWERERERVLIPNNRTSLWGFSLVWIWSSPHSRTNPCGQENMIPCMATPEVWSIVTIINHMWRWWKRWVLQGKSNTVIEREQCLGSPMSSLNSTFPVTSFHLILFQWMLLVPYPDCLSWSVHSAPSCCEGWLPISHSCSLSSEDYFQFNASHFGPEFMSSTPSSGATYSQIFSNRWQKADSGWDHALT